MAFKNITQQVADVVSKSGVQEGLVLCNAMHITASVFINDDERGLHEDYKKWLEASRRLMNRRRAISTIGRVRTMPMRT
jgi:thiamine phosphate synthase YjbQ (UPF0047 family)